jgi:class 3 adenylate cyclase
MTGPETGRPSGRAAFLFTDLQGSTRAWERAPERMNEVLVAHDRILRGAIAENAGAIFSTAGDAFGAAFHTAQAALATAVTVQRELGGGDWPEGLEPQVRMGLHVGSSFERDENYFGPTLNRAARLMHAAHGGQVVVSGELQQELSEVPSGVRLRDLGTFQLPDIGEPVSIWQVVIEGLRSEFPPLDTLGPPPPRMPRYQTSFIDRTE